MAAKKKTKAVEGAGGVGSVVSDEALDTGDLPAEKLFASAMGTASVMPEWVDIGEYASLRTIENVHAVGRVQGVMRTPRKVDAGPGVRIVLSVKAGYASFRLLPAGTEIPVTNVATAVPKGAALASRLRRTFERPVRPERSEPAEKNEASPRRAIQAKDRNAGPRTFGPVKRTFAEPEGKAPDFDEATDEAEDIDDGEE